MQLLVHTLNTVHAVAAIMPHLPLASMAAATDQIGQITSVIDTIRQDVMTVATSLAILMVVVAGLFIMLDRDMSTTKRNERLAFLRTILIGYGMILAANFLITLFQSLMGAVSQ